MLAGCVFARGRLFPPWSGELWEPPGQRVTGRDKMPDFASLKHSGLGRYCRFICPFSLIPFLARVGICLWPEHCQHAGLGTAARVSETARTSRGAIRCSAALGWGLRAGRRVSQDPF